MVCGASTSLIISNEEAFGKVCVVCCNLALVPCPTLDGEGQNSVCKLRDDLRRDSLPTLDEACGKVCEVFCNLALVPCPTLDEGLQIRVCKMDDDLRSVPTLDETCGKVCEMCFNLARALPTFDGAL